MARDQVYSNQSKVRPSEVTAMDGSKFIGATFLYLTLALIITFGVVGLMGGIFARTLYSAEVSDETLRIFLTIFIAALVLYIPVMIWVHIAARRGGRTVGPAFFTYSIVMGVLIAPVCIVFDFWTILIALGTTVLAFATMALIAWTSKRNLSSLAVIGFGLMIGALLLSLLNFVFYLIAPGIYQLTYALVSGLFFIAIILITIFDLNRVKNIAVNGDGTKNLAFLCALNLYVDFIYIFLRILRFVALIFGNRR